VILAQRAHFPYLSVDWQEILNIFIFDWESIIILDWMSIDMYRVLVEASVSSRYICMSEEHQFIIDARVREIQYEIRMSCLRSYEEGLELYDDTIIDYYEEIRVMVTDYARRHHEHLTEATTILELALWKAMILRSSGDIQGLNRVQCRTDAGCCAEVVIKYVLTFL
jgi:hypothetical protein